MHDSLIHYVYVYPFKISHKFTNFHTVYIHTFTTIKKILIKYLMGLPRRDQNLR